jgi:dTDP-D-glucose 4,6-dehydratase
MYGDGTSSRDYTYVADSTDPSEETGSFSE